MRHHHMIGQKYPKMPKIAIFDQKSWFFQSGYTCWYVRYMAGNMHLGCLRHILDAFMIYGVDLVHFWKNRKKSIFWLIFSDLRSYIYTNIMVPANYWPYGFAASCKHLRALSSKKCPSLSTFFPSVGYFLCFGAIFPKYGIFTKYDL